MGISTQQRNEIEQLLKQQIHRKLAEYTPETTYMPFHTRLLGKDRMALFSFIHSINTTLGTSVFEQVAAIIAKPYYRRAINQYKDFNDTISPDAHAIIQSIIDDLRVARKKPDKVEEINQILAIAQNGILRKQKRPRIELNP